jgi:paraquat-inducible protein A
MHHPTQPANARILPPKKIVRKIYLLVVLLLSLFFFILGLTHPILETGLGLLKGLVTINHEYIYLSGAFRYFINKGDAFIGILLLVFTIIMPLLKYTFLTLAIFNIRFKNRKFFLILLDVINKWSMLDVFVVALIILNMKFDSLVVISNLKAGTTYFSISVVLLMICSFLMKYQQTTTDEKGEKEIPG